MNCQFLSAMNLLVMMIIGLFPMKMLSAQEILNSNTFPVFGKKFLDSLSIPLMQAKIFIYRMDSSDSNSAINIYLNGHYHSSLLDSGYTEFCIEPGRLNLKAVDSVLASPIVKQDISGHNLELNSGQVVYVAVNGRNGNLVDLRELSKVEAIPQITRTSKQIHTFSRSPDIKKCNEEITGKSDDMLIYKEKIQELNMVNPIVDEPLNINESHDNKSKEVSILEKKYQMESDALFEFGKSDLNSAGQASLVMLKTQIEKDYLTIQKVTVLGHSDGIGPVKLNLELSKYRALTVVDYFKVLKFSPIDGFLAEGIGSANPVVNKCGRKPTKENKICQAPNRRVEISVFGIKR